MVDTGEEDATDWGDELDTGWRDVEDELVTGASEEEEAVVGAIEDADVDVLS